MLKGVVFDLDGTLIDSPLSLDQIRKELDFPHKTPILEHLSKLSPSEQALAKELIHSHEIKAAQLAELQPGVDSVLKALDENKIKMGLFTRNCKAATTLVIEKFSLKFNGIITRDCAPPKPDPAGLIGIVKAWGLELAQTVYVGDFLFDLQVGQNAGTKTALYLPNEVPDYADEADFVFTCYSDFQKLVLNL